MFRRIEDFTQAWSYESEATLKVFRAMTDASLSRAVTPEGRTLGRLAWHLTLTLREMLTHSGVEVAGPAGDAAQPPLAGIISAYERGAKDVADAITTRWTDAMLGDLVPMYGEQWPRGNVLQSLILHQAHHRGQMTVLMRQAGLAVPGVYGPAREEWAAMNMPPQE